MSRQRENIKASYEMLHPGLHQDEKQHMDTLRNQQDKIFQQLKKSKAKMVLKKKKLRQIYEELMKMYHQPDMELLQVRNEVCCALSLIPIFIFVCKIA